MELKRAEKRFKLTTRDYAELAAFRRALRGFLHFSEAAAARVGLSGRHYQVMLVLRGWPEGRAVTINDLAQQLYIKHNSAVGLVDRLVEGGFIGRALASADRRKVELHLTSRGRQVLAQLAAMHRAELKRIGPNFKDFFIELQAPARRRRRSERRGHRHA
jgi:DNA-binding MarR family transcriptional regulator